MKLEHVVAATDFSDTSVMAIKTALNLTQESGSTLYLVHVLDLPPVLDPMGAIPPPNTQELRDGAMEQLDDLVPKKLKQGLKIEKVVLEGRPANTIANFAKEKEADLIVVGTHGRTGLDRLLMDSTAEGLLRQSPCQVLVVKHKSTEEEASS